MGCPLFDGNCARALVLQGGLSVLQLERIVCCVPGSSSVRVSYQCSSGPDSVRQSGSLRLPQSPGGHQSQVSGAPGFGIVPLGGVTPSVFASRLLAGCRQYQSGWVESDFSEERVSLPLPGCISTVGGALGSTMAGSFRFRDICSSSSLCVVDTGSSSLGGGCSGDSVADGFSLRLSTFSSAASSPGEGPSFSGTGPPHSPLLDETSMVSASPRVGSGGAVVSSIDAVSGSSSSSSSGGSPTQTDGMVLERRGLIALGLSESVALAIQNSHRPATLRAYGRSWKIFASWCAGRSLLPQSCPATEVLEFLKDGFGLGLTVSTLRSHLAAVRVFRQFGSSIAPIEPLATRLLRSFFLARPVRRPCVPSWDLLIVLEGLQGPPFEPLESTSLRLLAAKVIFLVAITSARRIGDLRALLMDPPFLTVLPDKVVLRPALDHVPKVASSFTLNQPVVLPVFCPTPSSPEEVRLHTLDVRRALLVYLQRTAEFRDCRYLFVTFGGARRGSRPAVSTLSSWIRTAISLAYTACDRSPPVGVQARSTRGVASSWAFARGVSLVDICNAATWASPSTFMSHYRLVVGGGWSSSMGAEVLSAAVP